MNLLPAVWAEELRTDVLHSVVRWQLAKARGGNHQAKTRGEVNGTGKKLRAQKGTGKARAGSARAPRMVGGGIAHGPRTRSHAFDLNAKLRQMGMRVAVSARLREKLVTFVTGEMSSSTTKVCSHFVYFFTQLPSKIIAPIPSPSRRIS